MIDHRYRTLKLEMTASLYLCMISAYSEPSPVEAMCRYRQIQGVLSVIDVSQKFTQSIKLRRSTATAWWHTLSKRVSSLQMSSSPSLSLVRFMPAVGVVLESGVSPMFTSGHAFGR